MIEQVTNLGASAGEIAKIERHCFTHPWTQKQIAETLNGVFFIARAPGGAAVGYAGMTVVLDEAYVTNIAVLPGCRRQGIGERLLQSMLVYCAEQGCAFLSLEVRQSNFAAKNLYNKYLFSPVGERKNYYSEPTENAILMTRYFK